MEVESTSVHKRRSLPDIAMHKQSKTLSKSKPKIRIIHLYAPEIIKTDASNFRETVQKLTGKQDDHHNLHNQKGLKRNPRPRKSHDHHDRVHHQSHDHHDQVHHQSHDHDHDHHQVHDMNKNNGFCINSHEVEYEEEEDREEEMVSMTWNRSVGECPGEFLNDLGDVDGFIHELSEFPYLPLTNDPSVASSSHLHGGVFAESHQFA